MIDGHTIDWRKSRAKIAECIQMVRTREEHESSGDTRNRLKPVLVLLDGADERMATSLKGAIEREFEERKVSTVRTQVTILYLVAGYGGDMSQKDNVAVINHELCESEKTLFTERYDEVEKHPKIKIENILEFVVMASRASSDGPKPEYIQGVVEGALQDIDLYKEQADLLLYLSMMTVYGGDNRFSLPEKHCQVMVCTDETITPQPQFMRAICFQAKKFIIRDDRDPKQVVIRVPHAPVAKHLYKALAKELQTSSVLIRMLEEKKVQTFLKMVQGEDGGLTPGFGPVWLTLN